jgi:hypothetical protein
MLARGPAATRTVDIDGISTSLIEAGDGPPLLLLRHGWPLHLIDRAAHAPHIEQPEAFVDTLAAITSAA